MENLDKLLDMLQIYFIYRKNSELVHRLYCGRFSHINAPNRRNLKKIEKCLQRTGSLMKGKGNSCIQNKHLELKVLLYA